MNIILMGIKHCGKSTQGRIISKKLSVPFFDTDDIILDITGKSPRQIYTESGNSGFQDAEYRACVFLSEKIKSMEKKDLVTATGGGICTNKKALEVLRKTGVFVFLKTSEETAGRRVLREIKVLENGSLTNVPAFIAKKNPRTKEEAGKIFHEFFLEREKVYEEISDVTVDVTSSSKEDNAEKIIQAVLNKSR